MHIMYITIEVLWKSYPVLGLSSIHPKWLIMNDADARRQSGRYPSCNEMSAKSIKLAQIVQWDPIQNALKIVP
jgi:hypothetical protein